MLPSPNAQDSHPCISKEIGDSYCCFHNHTARRSAQADPEPDAPPPQGSPVTTWMDKPSESSCSYHSRGRVAPSGACGWPRHEACESVGVGPKEVLRSRSGSSASFHSAGGRKRQAEAAPPIQAQLKQNSVAQELPESSVSFHSNSSQ